MADWQTPKTDWRGAATGDDVYDVPGSADFNRIESNTEYLKGLEDGSVMAGNAAKLGGQLPSFYATNYRIVPSDTVILSLPTARQASYDNRVLIKEFRLKYPGIYRFKCEMRVGETEGKYQGYCQISTPYGTAWTLSKYTAGRYDLLTVDFGLPGTDGTIKVYAYATNSVSVRNVQICGTLTLAIPNNAVILN